MAEAFTESQSALQRILETLRAEPAVASLQTAGMDLYTDHEKTAQLSSYRASTGVQVVFSDVRAASAALGRAVAAGGDASRVHGLALVASSTEDAAAAARDAAWSDAARRAEQYAALAGRRLGAVLRVVEGAGHGGSVIREASAASADFEPGTQAVQTAVTVRWQLAAGSADAPPR